MRFVALDAGQSFSHCVVLELARFHGSLYLLVASIQAQLARGPHQQRRIVGIMGSVAPGTILGCQMSFQLLSLHNDRPHFLVALLETKLASRSVEQLFGLVAMRAVTGQAFTIGNRLMAIFPRQHRLVAFITQLDLRALAHLVVLLRSVRIMASQALSLRDRVVQHVSRSIHALVARQTQPGFGLYEFKFVLGSGERRVAHRALPYFQRAMQIRMLDDWCMAFAGNATPGGIGVLLFLGYRSTRQVKDRKKQEKDRSDWKFVFAHPVI